MKNFISTVVLTIALIALFSYFDYRPIEKPNGSGFGTKHKGDSGLILPGNGERMAEVNFEPKQTEEENEPIREAESSKETQATSKETQATSEETQATSEETSEETKEEHNKMDGMLLAFWHGVAAVLIGETSALMVAIAWMKIGGGKRGGN